MLIESVIKTEKRDPWEIELPYYCENEREYFLLLNEKEVVRIHKIQSHGWRSITKNLLIDSFINEISQATECTREVFDEAFFSTVNHIKASIIPPFK